MLRKHKFHSPHRRPVMGWYQCHLIVVATAASLFEGVTSEELLPTSFFFVFFRLRILQCNCSAARTSVGYKQLTGRRITLLVLPTFTFALRTNLSLLFINSNTIPNLHLCLGTTSSPITTTLPTFITAAPLPKLLQLCSPRPLKYSQYHTDQKCSTTFCNAIFLSHKSLPFHKIHRKTPVPDSLFQSLLTKRLWHRWFLWILPNF